MAKDIGDMENGVPVLGGEVLSATLFGAFRLIDENGEDRTPSSAKARALLAVVLIAPDQSRARGYLADTLWSDRARTQALGSLRQALSEVRAALGPYADCLEIDRKFVRIRADAVATDLADADTKTEAGYLFLEDVHAIDKAFSAWLTAARGQFGLRAQTLKKPLLNVQTNGSANPIHRKMIAHGISDGIADWCAMRIATASDDPDAFVRQAPHEIAEYLLSAHLEQGEANVAAHLTLASGAPGSSLWSMAGVLPGDPTALFEEAETYRLINMAVDRTMLDLAPPHGDTDTGRYLTAGALGATRRIFRNDPGDLDVAKDQLCRNFDIHGHGVYLAWQAYITTIEMAETEGADRDALAAEADELTARALERDPYGSMTLSLCSYVNSFVLGRREIGHDLACRALEANRANPLAWMFRGASRFLEGDGERAGKDTEFARQISGEGPYKYVIETFCCAAATAAGRFDDAIGYAESAARRAPRYRAPLRYLVAIHSARGDIDKLRLALRRLRMIEPEFTLDSLRNRAYPVPGLRAAGLTDPT